MERKDQERASRNERFYEESNKPVYGTLESMSEESNRVQYRSIATGHRPTASSYNSNIFSEDSTQTYTHSKQPLIHETSHRPVTFGPRTDKTNYGTVVPRPLPPHPFRLEIHTHFHVKSESVPRVCMIIGQFLCDKDTDFVFKTDKCKWVVEYRRENSLYRVMFNIKLFKTSNKACVVEVQRREGDITALVHGYAELKNSFRKFQLLVEKSTPTKASKRPISAISTPNPCAIEHVNSAIKAINGLLDSKFDDARMQGVLGLLSLASNESTKNAEMMKSLVSRLVMLLQTNNKTLLKLAHVALTSLCENRYCRDVMRDLNGWQEVLKYACGGTNVDPELQRASLRIVTLLCPLVSTTLRTSQHTKSMVTFTKNWHCVQDPRLQQYAYNAHHALSAAGIVV
uniref:Uncharacterized protein AlNc14C165G7864 n=1 Tax=Albugo laibachii Nc14 TaxID=890382 RepID=F0WN32_9STRA|nr:conserved hypothetical protein [Albugo laibachii Nc14]|eukprot:CCA22719.1 conserved hypothetical protein [Albugo laibachii Nc14]